MTDSGPPTDLGTIYAVGQRRRPGGLFPPSSGGSGGSSDIPPDEAQETEEDEQAGGGLPLPPCSDPGTALEWNADAAAAEAAKEFARMAAARMPPEDLNTREWSCYLYRAADGSVQRGPITYGDPFANGGVGTVTPSDTGLDPATIIGSVHSHASGSHLPSTGPGPGLENRGDIGHVITTSQWVSSYGGNGSIFRGYIIAQNQGPAGFVPYNQINIYTPETVQAARDTNTPGPEVNPEAEPCPGN